MKNPGEAEEQVDSQRSGTTDKVKVPTGQEHTPAVGTDLLGQTARQTKGEA